jgi:outer membrane protein assembly factor BamB
MTQDGDPCDLVETNAANGWGTAQQFYQVPTGAMASGQTRGLVERAASSSERFRITYPKTGRYEALFDVEHRTLTVRDASGSTSGDLVWSVMGAGARTNTGELYLRSQVRAESGLWYDTLARLDPATGRRLWTHDFVNYPSVTCARPSVLVVSQSYPKAVVGLDPTTGARQWTREDASAPAYSNPGTNCGVPDLTIVERGDGRGLMGLRNDGTALWDRVTEASTRIDYSSANAVIATVFPSGASPFVLALDPATGNVRWRTEGASFSPDNQGQPYFVSGDEMKRRDLVTGATVWSYDKTGQSLVASNADTLYFRAEAGIIAVSKSSGQKLFTLPVAIQAFASFVAFDKACALEVRDSSYTQTEVTRIDCRTGKTLWTRTKSSPAALFAADTEGRTYVSGKSLERISDAGQVLWSYVAPPSTSGELPNISRSFDSTSGTAYFSYSYFCYMTCPTGLAAIDPATGVARWARWDGYPLNYLGADTERLYFKTSSRGGDIDLRAYAK